MSAFVTHAWFLTGRHLRWLSREPAYLLFTLAQPMVWLLLFSQLFRRVVDIPGFEAGSYVGYLTPGVIIMTAVMTATWAGTSFIDDMSRGVMDRSLSSPVSRLAILAGNAGYHAVISLAQTLIVLGVGFALGARYDGGLGAVAVVALSALLVMVLFAALSCAMALVLRSQEALIGMSQMLTLPLVFISSVLIAPDLMPGWMRTVARINPIDWAARASREALLANPDWSVIGSRTGLLLALGLTTTWLATRAFAAYQRSL